MKYQELKEYLLSSDFDQILRNVICCDDIGKEKERYLTLLEEAFHSYGDGDYHFISSPGRSEIGGNHTDHQHGHVLAAALNIDNLAVVKANDDQIVRYYDKAFTPIEVDLKDLSIHEEEKNTSYALIRGIAAKLEEEGYKTGGFYAICDSHVLIGSGISSSACFEVMVAEIFSALYNDDSVTPVQRAIYGQYAENVYFGKPSGLMDQTAISVGGFVAIDFKDSAHPVIENHDFSFSDYGYELILVNTKGDHADLSDEYAAITREIKDVAHELGVEYLADSDLETLLKNLPSIREKLKNDRGLLRSIHFYNEDERAVKQKEAVKEKDIDRLLSLMKESARSSYEYLQNINVSSRPWSQSLGLALALVDTVLQGEGACRVHGGGFEGTIQIVCPKDKVRKLKETMNSVFGDDSVMELKVRPSGTKLII
ncbi:MAG: galactokinase [Erysipelotrichaceae bacterium]|nr:galactokinase [Erysipelotrichaceae bacterium]